MVNKDLLPKLEALQKILPPVIQKIKDNVPLAPEDIDKEVIKALQKLGGDAYNILTSDFGVFHMGKDGNLRVVSEWAYQADRAEEAARR